jgi:hypothetical protein
MTPLAAFYVAVNQGRIPVAVPTDTGLLVSSLGISTAQGTFLARSDNKRARALAAVMAIHDAREASR